MGYKRGLHEGISQFSVGQTEKTMKNVSKQQVLIGYVPKTSLDSILFQSNKTSQFKVINTLMTPITISSKYYDATRRDFLRVKGDWSVKLAITFI